MFYAFFFDAVSMDKLFILQIHSTNVNIFLFNGWILEKAPFLNKFLPSLKACIDRFAWFTLLACKNLMFSFKK